MKPVITFLMLWPFFASTTLAQSDIGCYVPGECLGALYVEFDTLPSAVDCHQLCIDTDGCEYWTHYAYDSDPICFAFVDCPDFGQNCEDCTSGEKDCDFFEQCEIAGECEGTEVNFFTGVDSLGECAEYCICDDECNFWTYDSDSRVCILTEDCFVVDTSCTTCMAGATGCDASVCTAGTTESLDYCPAYVPPTTPGPDGTTLGGTTGYATGPTTGRGTTTEPGTTIDDGECPDVIQCLDEDVALEDTCLINSPGYPGYDSCLCQNMIIHATSPGDIIQLQFENFNIDSSCCDCDTVTLWDGGAVILAELNGCDDPTALIYRAYSGEMWLRFVSDNTNEGNGDGYVARITRG